MENIGILDAGVIALLGYAVVFFGLILLMIVITIMGKFFTAKAKAPAAPGSAGPVKLYDTPPKTAAMIMAIVANQMGKPLNELRFISIKEVKD